MAVEAEGGGAALVVGAAGGAFVAAHGVDVEVAEEIGVEAVAVLGAGGEVGAAAAVAELGLFAFAVLSAFGIATGAVFAKATAEAGEVAEAALQATSVDAGLQTEAAHGDAAFVVGEAGRTTLVGDAQLAHAVDGAAVVVFEAGLGGCAGAGDADARAALGIDGAVVEAADALVADAAGGVTVEETLGVVDTRGRRRWRRVVADAVCADEACSARGVFAALALQGEGLTTAGGRTDDDDDDNDEAEDGGESHGSTWRSGVSRTAGSVARARTNMRAVGTVGRWEAAKT